jgi:hypothetical protein
MSLCIDAITSYIYRCYRYEETLNTFEQDMARVLGEMRQEQEVIIEHIIASATREYALYFERILQRKRFSIHGRVALLNEQNEQNEIRDCCICMESYPKDEFVTLHCNHEFCHRCLHTSLLSDKRPEPCCAYCRANITQLTFRTQKIYNEFSDVLINTEI